MKRPVFRIVKSIRICGTNIVTSEVNNRIYTKNVKKRDRFGDPGMCVGGESETMF
jgi:hypothetical protein